MSPETLARWQFGITTVYHYFFVPLTIALSLLVAVLQTMWFRTGQDKFLRLTKFYGKLFLINFAMGVVTGIVQEFQFGMNWSEYSRFVGDIFGAPLALEALLAFFLESTFLGAWIFGWDRLPKKIHLMTIWLAAFGTMLSAIFILAANSWMQNPLGYQYNPVTDRAELTDFGAVMTNPVLLITFPHTLAASYLVATGFIAGIAGWHLARLNKAAATTPTLPADTEAEVDAEATAAAERAETDRQEQISGFRWALKFGAIGLLISGLAVCITGDIQGKVMTDVQPMKMAAAEALYDTEAPASFSVLTIGTLDGSEEVYALTVPYVLSFLATGTLDGEVRGINDLQAEYEEKYGHFGIVDFSPNIPVTYWSFRAMMGLGFLAMAIGAYLLWVVRKNHLPRSSWWFTAICVIAPLAPMFANSFGWIFTEMGRQPWLVFGVMPTAAGVSPGVGAGTVLTSMIVFTLLYGGLAVIEVGLMLKYIKEGLPEAKPVEVVENDDQPLSFAY